MPKYSSSTVSSTHRRQGATKVVARGNRGFTLPETLIALAILATAITGAFAGILNASNDLREAQLRQYKMALIDATAQRLTLASKASFSASAVLQMPSISPDLLKPGTAPWQLDSTSPSTGDLSTGAYFQVLPNGQIQHVTFATSLPCGSSSLPQGTYCREVLLAPGLSGPNSGALPPGAQAYTQWIRVSRQGEPLSSAVVYRKTFTQ